LQNCLIGGFYAIPALIEMESTTQNLKQTLSSLPGQVGASGANCTASTETINNVSTNLSNVINEAALIAVRINDVQAVLGGCLPASSSDSINQLTAKVTNLKTNSDKGCSIPQDQMVQGITLPNCMNSVIANTGGNSAVAGDGKIEGCELFMHCSGQTKCF
jgi:7-keto-8-aminopelargonate synthetase-like enzyme